MAAALAVTAEAELPLSAVASLSGWLQARWRVSSTVAQSATDAGWRHRRYPGVDWSAPVRAAAAWFWLPRGNFRDRGGLRSEPGVCVVGQDRSHPDC